MKGDFSRETFRPRQHYWGVLRQQGRVDLDADWNEQVRIGRHEHRARSRDLVGESGGPFANAGFGIASEGDGGLLVGGGRYYVSGILCENDESRSFDDQPDPPGEDPPSDDGIHLAYLDVWDRLVTAVDDPLIRETALGGPDTATRARTVWQVRTAPLEEVSDELQTAITAYLQAVEDGADDAEVEAALAQVHALVVQADCEDPLDPAGGSLDPDAGLLAAQASDSGAEPDDPCRFEPEGGYRRLENRLYRVEIHQPGGEGEASFKWSRDNGSVVVPIEQYELAPGETDTKRVKVRRLGFDELSSLAQDQYVEIVTDDDELAGRPGKLVQITNSPDAERRVLELSERVDAKDLGLHPKVRRWDMRGDQVGEDPDEAMPVAADEWIELEDGVEVRFRDGRFHTGDYWLIPARTATGDVEWPPSPTYLGEPVDPEPADLPPAGIAHHRAPLAAIVREGAEVVTVVDLRRLFPATTALHTLRYAGGDGQEPVLGDGLLPSPLQASVTNGDQPVAGSLVRFTVVDGEGELATSEAWDAPEDTVTVPTTADGLASAHWRLDVSAANHRVEARLLDACGDPVGAPVFFNARVNFQLHYLGGDGQEARPGGDLTLEPLRVWVSDGRWPLPGATVAFEVTEGAGTLDADAQTGPDGVAECRWTLDATTPRQQVVARLLDAEGDPVHEAAVTFNANLSLASEVAYEPADDCVALQDAATVQEALDELCRREQGGSCTFAVEAGTDVAALFEMIQGSDRDDFAVCFAAGVFEVAEPLRLTGKGSVRVSGAGKATRIVARDAESALRFEQCASVEVRGLVVEAGATDRGEGLGGALAFVDCGPVTVEDAVAACGNGPERRAAAITVRRSGPDAAAGPVRVRGCDVVVGEEQIGILIVNAQRVHVEDNTVVPGEFTEKETLAAFLANRRYRAMVRRRLVSFDEIAEDDPARAALDVGMGEVFIDVAEGGLTFRSEMSGSDRQETWQEEINRTEVTSVREAKEALVEMADTILREEGAWGTRRVFRDWYRGLEERRAVVGEAGILVGGTVADEVRVVRNSVRGVLRGVSVGLSDRDGAGYHAGVVEVAGNTVLVPGDTIKAQYGDGVFVGNCDSLLVGDNTVRVVVPEKAESSLAVDGVRVDGVLGPRAIVRANHFDRTVVGARIDPANPPDETRRTPPRRWLAADNVATSGPMLLAPCHVLEDGNVPPRTEPCPGDRPAGWPSQPA